MRIPQISYTLEVPEILVNSARVHNRLVKIVVRQVLEHHWRKRIPEHFKTSAHQKYGYLPRSAKYIRAKARRYGSTVDLVKTGAAKSEMTTRHRITIGGSAMNNDVAGKLTMRFPFPGGTGKKDSRKKGNFRLVDPAQMIREMQAITADELTEINRQIADGYIVLVDTSTSKRMRIKGKGP